MKRLGFLGGGHMAAALVEGLSKQKDEALSLLVYDPDASRCRHLQQFGVTPAASNGEVIAGSDWLFIAVKPQVYAEVEAEIAAHYRAGQLVISLLAGTTLARIGAQLPAHKKLVRLMPNLAMAVGAGTCLLSANEQVTAEEKSAVKALLATTGLVQELPESSIDAATAIAGSGPAFFYMMIEGLTLGGINMGLPRDTALALANQTMLGTARLLQETGEHPAALRDRVLSPGGATIAGVEQLENGGFRGDLIKAVTAAAKRAADLGGKGGQLG